MGGKVIAKVFVFTTISGLSPWFLWNFAEKVYRILSFLGILRKDNGLHRILFYTFVIYYNNV